MQKERHTLCACVLILDILLRSEVAGTKLICWANWKDASVESDLFLIEINMACFTASKLHGFVDLRPCHNCLQFVPASLRKKSFHKACANATSDCFTASDVYGSTQRQIHRARSILCRSHQDVDQDFIDAINNVRDIAFN